MENQSRNNQSRGFKNEVIRRKSGTEIDLLRLGIALAKKFWLLLLAAVFGGLIFLSGTLLFIKPTYTAKALLYVNNSSVSVGSTKIDLGDLSAAQSLVDTYVVIMKSRTVLEDVIDKYNFDISYEDFCDKITAGAVDETEVFSIDVVDTDPEMAQKYANAIAKELPDSIESIIDGASTRIVDYAVVPSERTGPSYVRNTILGAIICLVIMGVIVVIYELRNDQIKTQNDLIESINYPVLAAIPELVSSKSSKGYGYYNKNYHKGR